jgi:hypothetical protein
MPLPEFNTLGELPLGIWPANIKEVLERFGNFGENERKEAAATLAKIHGLAVATGHLASLLVFGSFVTAKPDPNDVDVVLIMDDQFTVSQCPVESQVLFDHQAADLQLGASVFWMRPSFLFGDTIDAFRARWQLTRDQRMRGIVEVLT